MRIQHNVMAMNAYRNYSNNTKALSKNLERLSSGYKINRAGDDAAGLAISEKMRAQITGLEAAQKNVKDGISLVNTAEGAMQEVQDMLNRMVYLAQESANGTYDNEVDRMNLQKEMDQLNAEIDRIADSANFNGIKLLDGSLDAGGETVSKAGKFTVTDSANAIVGNLPEVGETLGTNTVLHKEAATAVDNNTFSVDLHNLEFSNKTNAKIEIKIGDDTFTLAQADSDVAAGTAMTAEDLATAFAAGGKFKVGTTALTAGKAEIGGVEYAVTADGTRLTFTTAEDVDSLPAEVTIKDPDVATVPAKKDKYVSGAIGYTAATTAGPGASVATVAYTKADGTTATKEVNFNAVTDDATTATNLLNALKADTDLAALFDITGSATGISFEAKVAGTGKGAVTGFTLKSTGDGATGDQATIGAKDATNSVAGANETTPDSNVTGDYNKSTTVIESKTDAGDFRLASTKFTLTADMTGNGSTITIGKDTYTFTTDTDKVGEEGYVVIGEGESLTSIAEKLTKAAEDNATYTVGHDGTSITITEVKDQKNFDLTTASGIEKSLGFNSVTTTKATGSALTLQIGDTSDSFNQLKVSIGDIHAKALGTASLDISTQQGAAAAVDQIKAAINRVSTIRGTLGATSNRLDHTANNLSVMRENITDAESAIRDTDIAEEMMAYTKNNILVQSAQAMLAQANQVPQGVLQLLQ